MGVGARPRRRRGPARTEGEVRQVTPRMAPPFPDQRRIPSRPLATTRDIADESGFLGRPLVQDLMAGTGEDQEFSCHTGRIGSQNVYTAALVCWNRRRPAAE